MSIGGSDLIYLDTPSMGIIAHFLFRRSPAARSPTAALVYTLLGVNYHRYGGAGYLWKAWTRGLAQTVTDDDRIR